MRKISQTSGKNDSFGIIEKVYGYDGLLPDPQKAFKQVLNTELSIIYAM